MELYKKLKVLAFCLCVAFIGCVDHPSLGRGLPASANPPDSQLTPISRIQSAFENQEENVSVTVKGRIDRILPDEHDSVGDDHQRWIIRLSNGQTILIVHNIRIAPRVAGIAPGSEVVVHGDYVWNSHGGLIHWTHHDPDGSHENGWIVFEGRKFE
jgi:hypothetical protein